MDSECKIRINFENKELEVSGTQEFVEAYFDQYLDYLLDSNVVVETKTKNGGSESRNQNSSFPDSFGEYFHKFPISDMTDVDKFLVAAYYIQNTNESNTFNTREVNSLLKDFGVSLSNASDNRSANKEKKFIYPHSGKEYKVAIEGKNYIETLIE